VVVSQRFLDARPKLKNHAILIASQSYKTNGPSLYSGIAIDMVGYGMTVSATKPALDEAGATPKDIKVRELHDCFSINQLI